ncbi:MAG: formamidopyrimidine-DNA glycosylase [Planctomycetes bacterium]|nr:formamidopyrimidine-DNA glycosylase [Planctomycetota bacterium]MCC7398983.1 formamidopyrimidine-DNA glycosylase [Planctomycetota bacterium]
MPELPDVTVYQERLRALHVGHRLLQVRLLRAFLLRTVTPSLDDFAGRPLRTVERLGKRLVFGFDDERYLVLHLMIAGRLQWYADQPKPGARNDLAGFDFDHGVLVLTEAGSKRRASLHAVAGRAALAEFDRGGLELAVASSADFAARLRLENRTLKRALTDPRLFSGIGNAYSDEILHAARLSPVMLTSRLDDDEVMRLFAAARRCLEQWTDRLRRETGDGWPRRVTAFRDGMAVHGRYGRPCPDCQAPVQRIRYADHECNYCVNCQCGGRLLADRGLSQLLRRDWPRTLAELEERRSSP